MHPMNPLTLWVFTSVLNKWRRCLLLKAMYFYIPIWFLICSISLNLRIKKYFRYVWEKESQVTVKDDGRTGTLSFSMFLPCLYNSGAKRYYMTACKILWGKQRGIRWLHILPLWLLSWCVIRSGSWIHYWQVAVKWGFQMTAMGSAGNLFQFTPDLLWR